MVYKSRRVRESLMQTEPTLVLPPTPRIVAGRHKAPVEHRSLGEISLGAVRVFGTAALAGSILAGIAAPANAEESEADGTTLLTPAPETSDGLGLLESLQTSVINISDDSEAVAGSVDEQSNSNGTEMKPESNPGPEEVDNRVEGSVAEDESKTEAEVVDEPIADEEVESEPFVETEDVEDAEPVDAITEPQPQPTADEVGVDKETEGKAATEEEDASAVGSEPVNPEEAVKPEEGGPGEVEHPEANEIDEVVADGEQEGAEGDPFSWMTTQEVNIADSLKGEQGQNNPEGTVSAAQEVGNGVETEIEPEDNPVVKTPSDGEGQVVDVEDDPLLAFSTQSVDISDEIDQEAPVDALSDQGAVPDEPEGSENGEGDPGLGFTTRSIDISDEPEAEGEPGSVENEAPETPRENEGGAEAGEDTEQAEEPKKSNTEIAHEVLEDKWGRDEERIRMLTEAGYDYDAVQAEVNKILEEQKISQAEESPIELPASATAPSLFSMDRPAQAELKAKYGNVSGKLADDELVTVEAPYRSNGMNEWKLSPKAAEAFNAMNAEFMERTGSSLCIAQTYRSYEGQVKAKAKHGKGAAEPGNSNHGWGDAIDFCDPQNPEGQVRRDAEFYKVLEEIGPKYGFINPHRYDPRFDEFYEDGSKRIDEPWHWEFVERHYVGYFERAS